MPLPDDKGEIPEGDRKRRVWKRRGETWIGGNMVGDYKHVVAKTVGQLCCTNPQLEGVGVSEQQLHAILSLRLGPRLSPLFISILIERELQTKAVIKNHLGNIVINSKMSKPAEENSSESDSTELTVDSDLAESLKSKETRSPSPEGQEEEEDKPVVKRRRRWGKRSKGDEEEERSGEGSSPRRLVNRSAVLNHRRVSRKITKYDPSEFYLTPLIRKKNKGVVVQPKPKLKRGRPVKNIEAKALSPPSKKEEAKKTEEVKKTENVRGRGRRSRGWEEVEEDDEEEEESPEEDLPIATTQRKQTVVHMEKSEGWMLVQGSSRSAPKSDGSLLRSECFICTSPAEVNDEVNVLACSLCLNIAHSDCVEDDGFYKILKKWRCSQCLERNPLSCSVCYKEYNKRDGGVVVCDGCDEVFHLRCHVPQVKKTQPLSAPWRCSFCPLIATSDPLIGGREDLKSLVGTHAYGTVPRQRAPRSDLEASRAEEEAAEADKVCQPPRQGSAERATGATPSAQLNTTPCEPGEIQIKEEVVEVKEEAEESESEPARYLFHEPGEPIPRVDEWTPQQVANYFSLKLGSSVGNAFLAQEIDGRSLKLLRRADVTDKLGLPFGIALKVLYYVKKIQLNTNVIQELWA